MNTQEFTLLTRIEQDQEFKARVFVDINFQLFHLLYELVQSSLDIAQTKFIQDVKVYPLTIGLKMPHVIKYKILHNKATKNGLKKLK